MSASATYTPPVAPAWGTGGNTDTGPGNYIGTADADPVAIRTNAQDRVFITPAGLIGVGTTTPAGGFDLNTALIARPISIGDLPTGGAIGTAAVTVDAAPAVTLNQTTAGQTLTLPNPTNAQAGRIVIVRNDGTASVTLHGSSVAAGGAVIAHWNGATWAVVGAVPTPVDFWRSGAGATTLPDGTNDLTEAIRRNGNVGINIDAVAALDVNGSVVHRAVTLANFAANAAIGTAAATVDIASTIIIPQNTVGIALTIPAATTSAAGRMVRLINTGTNLFTVGGLAGGAPTTTVPPASHVDFVWNGAAWCPDASSGALDFWRSGATGTVLPDGTTDTADSIAHDGSVVIGDLNAPSVIAGAPAATNHLRLHQTAAEFTQLMRAGQAINYVMRRAIPTVVNDCIDICSIAGNAAGTHPVILTINVGDGGFATSKTWVVTPAWNATGNAWRVATPLSDGGPFGGNNFELLVRVGNQTISFKIRRTSGATAGTARITLQTGDDFDAVITESSAVAADAGVYAAFATTAAAVDFWRSGAGATTLPDGTNDLTEAIRRNGNVGINVDPTTALDVATSAVRVRRGNTSAAFTQDQLLLAFTDGQYQHAIKSRHNNLGQAGNAIDVYGWQQGTDAAATVGTRHLVSLTTEGQGRVGLRGKTAPHSTLDVNGSFAPGFLVVNSLAAALTLDETHHTIEISATISGTINLPSPAGIAGREYRIYFVGNILQDAVATVTLSTAAGAIYSPRTGAGATTLDMQPGGIRSITLVSDGANWHGSSYVVSDERIVFTNNLAAGFTLGAQHHTLEITAATTGTITLPSPAGIAGREYRIYFVGNVQQDTTAVATVTTPAGAVYSPTTGNGAATFAMAPGGIRSATFVSDGSNWHVASYNVDVDRMIFVNALPTTLTADAHHTLMLNGALNGVINIPSAANLKGHEFRIFYADNVDEANAVAATITPAGNNIVNPLNGAVGPTVDLTPGGMRSITIVSDGSTWRAIDWMFSDRGITQFNALPATVTEGQQTVLLTGGANGVLNIPTAANVGGRLIRIFFGDDVDEASNAIVTITPAANFIYNPLTNGAAATLDMRPGGIRSLTLVSDGTNWRVIDWVISDRGFVVANALPFTLSESHQTLMLGNVGGVLNIPSAAGIGGREYKIFYSDTVLYTANLVTTLTAAGNFIYNPLTGAAAATLDLTPGGIRSITIVSDGTNWRIRSHELGTVGTVSVGGALTLDGNLHNRRTLLVNGAQTITIPAALATNFGYFECDVVADANAVVTIAAGAGVTMFSPNGATTPATRGSMKKIKFRPATNVAYIS